MEKKKVNSNCLSLSRAAFFLVFGIYMAGAMRDAQGWVDGYVWGMGAFVSLSFASAVYFGCSLLENYLLMPPKAPTPSPPPPTTKKPPQAMKKPAKPAPAPPDVVTQSRMQSVSVAQAPLVVSKTDEFINELKRHGADMSRIYFDELVQVVRVAQATRGLSVPLSKAGMVRERCMEERQYKPFLSMLKANEYAVEVGANRYQFSPLFYEVMAEIFTETRRHGRHGRDRSAVTPEVVTANTTLSYQ